MGYSPVSPDDPRVQKLPGWAQILIQSLARDVSDAERHAEKTRLTTSPADSDTIIDRMEGGDIGLGNGPTVTFLLGPGFHERVDIRVSEGKLFINGYDGIVVLPSAANSIRIVMEDRGRA